MSETNVDISVIKRTQETLGKFVKKPPLSEKLLKKPPFRFLHDIVNVIIKDTGYLKGLYSDDELNSENIKDRDAKIKFLQSLIDVVKLSTGENITVRPSKIVAGQEPEKTNELLQAIAKAIESNIDSTQFIEKLKSGNVPKTKKGSISKNETNKLLPPSKPIESNKTKKIDTQSIKTNENKIKRPDNTVKTKPIVKEVKTIKDKPVKEKDSKIARSQHGVPSKPEKTISNQQKKSNGENIRVQEVISKQNIPSRIIVPNPSFGEKVEAEKDIQFGDETSDSLQKSVIKNNEKNNEQSSINQVENEKLELNVVQIQNQSVITPPQTNEEIIIKSSKKIQSLDEKPKYWNSTDELSAIIDAEAERRREEKRISITDSRSQNVAPDNTLEILKQKESIESSEITNENIKVPSTANLKNDLNSVTSSIPQPTGEPRYTRPRTSLRPPSVRPASARPGAPRRRDKNIEIVLQPDEQIKLGDINVKVESFSNELEDDGENLIIIEDADPQTTDALFKTSEFDSNQNDQQGHLVQQILDTQKEFTNITSTENEELTKDWKKQRLTSAHQVDSLKDALQKLTRSVNPLGKLLDFLQEDIDAMERELETWKTNYKQTKIMLSQEKGLTETAIEPMKHQLAQIELSFKEHCEMINASRANILQNEQKIYKLLTDI